MKTFEKIIHETDDYKYVFVSMPDYPNMLFWVNNKFDCVVDSRPVRDISEARAIVRRGWYD